MTELSERLVKAKAALFGGTEADWKAACAAIDEAIAVLSGGVTEEMIYAMQGVIRGMTRETMSDDVCRAAIAQVLRVASKE